MHRLTSAICWLILGTGLVLAFAQPAADTQKQLQGTWTATQAERDGTAANDVLGHQLSLTGTRFQSSLRTASPSTWEPSGWTRARSQRLLTSRIRKGPSRGRRGRGIYVLDGDTLTVCDNAPNLDQGRPAAFEAPRGSGYVLITFKRAKP